MALLRRCRVNAALTIQLFSQLFHFLNMWLFNRLVTDPESGLCSHYWGAIIRQQLGHVEAWAEKQGLELAADCHLSRIVQVGGPRPASPRAHTACDSLIRSWAGTRTQQNPTLPLGVFVCTNHEAMVCSFAWVPVTSAAGCGQAPRKRILSQFGSRSPGPRSGGLGSLGCAGLGPRPLPESRGFAGIWGLSRLAEASPDRRSPPQAFSLCTSVSSVCLS